MSNQDLLGISKRELPVKNGDSTLLLSSYFSLTNSDNDPSIDLTVLVQRVGNMMYGRGHFFISNPSVSVGLYLNLPSFLHLDTKLFPAVDLKWQFGSAINATISGTPQYITADGYQSAMTFDTAHPNSFYFTSKTLSGLFSGAISAGAIGNTGDRIVFNFCAPIKEWRE